MINRKNDSIVIQDRTMDNKIDHYEILAIVPFSSETKKMRIFIRNQQNNNILLLVKGAESEICKLVNNNESQWLN